MEAALADAIGQRHVTFYHAGLADSEERAARQASLRVPSVNKKSNLDFKCPSLYPTGKLEQ